MTTRHTETATFMLPDDRGTVIVLVATDGLATSDEIRLFGRLRAIAGEYCHSGFLPDIQNIVNPNPGQQVQ